MKYFKQAKKYLSYATTGGFCAVMSVTPSIAAPLIDATAVSAAETDILADVAVVAGLCITVMLALIGFAWAMRAGRKGGG